MSKHFVETVAVIVAAGVLLLDVRATWAHCDTMDGPVVKDARAALAAGDVTPVLKWVNVQQESDVRAAFQKTLAVRGKGQDARELADIWFFETVVRLHRAHEGEPFTGLKPAGTNPGPAIAAADKALDGGNVEPLVREVLQQAERGIRQRFAEAAEKRGHAGQSVEAGRQYVRAYVEFVHYVERLHDNAIGQAGEQDKKDSPSSEAHQHH